MIPAATRTPVNARPTEPCVQGGRYWLRSPSGVLDPYTRVTRWVESLEDPWAVHRWRMRHLTRAVTLHPELAAELAAATTDDEAETIIERCLDAVGANERRDLGTSIHTWCEELMSGIKPDCGEHLPVVEAIARTLDNNQLTPIEIEGTVVCTGIKVAGKRDLVCARADGSTVVVDYKTGSYISHGSWAVQLACYAHADLRYVWTDHTWADRLDTDTTSGLILHADARGSIAQLHSVDLAWGWKQATETIPAIRDARNESKHRARGGPYGVPTIIDRNPEALADLLEQSVRAVNHDWTPIAPARPVLEDRSVDDETVAGMRRRLSKLPAHHRALLDLWATEAADAGLTLNISKNRTLTRFEQLRAACDLAAVTDGDLDQCLAAIRTLDGWGTTKIGNRLAALDLNQLAKLQDLIPRIPTLTLNYDKHSPFYDDLRNPK